MVNVIPNDLSQNIAYILSTTQ